MPDFTIEKYGNLRSAVKGNYETLTFNEYLNNLNPENKFIILRHDVDRMPENALKTAEVEREFDIKSTYYSRANQFKNNFVN